MMATKFRFLRFCVRLFATALVFAIMALSPINATFAATGSVVYTYDATGRLIMAGYDNGLCVVYSYDANGNRLSETTYVSSSGSTGVWGCFVWGQALWGN